MNKYFAKPPTDRQHLILNVEDALPPDHPVRLFDELLQNCDWTSWEDHYHGHRGQPAIPPRILAAILLYGMSRGFRSSRTLEYLCTHNIDFLWLAEGFRPDHSTLCAFRTDFAQPLKVLFRQVGRLAFTMGVLRLGQIAFDGTRVRANNHRSKTDTVPRLEKQLQVLQEQLEAWFDKHSAEAVAADADEKQFRAATVVTPLPPELADWRTRQAQMNAALAYLREQDSARAKEGIDPKKNPAQLPRTDPDAKVMPNKEGGNAPNYTPLTAIDVASGLVAYCDVTAGVAESPFLTAAVDQVEQDFGVRPGQVLADSHLATGENLKRLEERQVEFFTPVASPDPQSGNPACRSDATQPVPPKQWDALPRNRQGQLDKSAFVYDADQDRYYCPQGQPLPYAETKTEQRQGETVSMRVYRCRTCAGCPLAAACVGEKNRRGRTVRRDQYEPYRQRAAARMATVEGKRVYGERFHAAEAPFGILKAVMGLRQFLLRGLKKVDTEWRWACTAYNLKKLVGYVATLRAARVEGEPAVALAG